MFWRTTQEIRSGEKSAAAFDPAGRAGDKAKERPDGKYTPFYQERLSDIQYYRAFEIGSQVDQGKIEAVYANGVLKVTLPKSEKVLPRTIEITDS